MSFVSTDIDNMVAPFMLGWKFGLIAPWLPQNLWDFSVNINRYMLYLTIFYVIKFVPKRKHIR